MNILAHIPMYNDQLIADLGVCPSSISQTGHLVTKSSRIDTPDIYPEESNVLCATDIQLGPISDASIMVRPVAAQCSELDEEMLFTYDYETIVPVHNNILVIEDSSLQSAELASMSTLPRCKLRQQAAH